MPLSPPCQSTVLLNLNSGVLASPNSNTPPVNDTTSPVNHDGVEDELIACVDDENVSLSSDETWTPSIEREDSDDDDLNDDGST